jgi:hypothetical protein
MENRYGTEHYFTAMLASQGNAMEEMFSARDIRQSSGL